MHRQIFIVLFLAVFAAMLGMGIVAPLLPIYAQHYGAKGLLIGLVFASFSISRTVLLPFIGMISDKRGRKVFITMGLLLFALTSLGYVASKNIEQLIITRMLQGVAAALVIPIALAYMGEITPKGKEGSYMGVFNIFFFGGLAMGPILGGIVKDLLGVKFSFYTMGLASLVGFFLTLFFLPERTRARQTSPHSPWPLKRIFEGGRIKGVYLFRLCFSIGIGLTWAFVPIFGDNFLTLTSSQIGVLISLNVLIATLLQAPCGMLTDRFSKGGFVVIGGSLAAGAIFLMPLTRDFGEILFVNILLGVSGGISMPAVTALAVEEGKRIGGMGTLMSIFTMCHSIGMIIGPILAGAVAEIFNITLVFFIGALVGLMGVGGFALFLRRSPSV
ncbi:MAG: MFS transporter [Deltaproteobacteria bacterium]|nr:MFS transporter [Deltaproteobacteria bacterium]